MKKKDRQLLKAVKLVPEYIGDQVGHQPNHEQIKPPGIVNNSFGGLCSKIVLNECGHPDGGGKSKDQETHGFHRE
jgi:hypothetical protein